MESAAASRVRRLVGWLLVVAGAAPCLWTLVECSGASRAQFLALIGPSLLPAAAWAAAAATAWAPAGTAVLVGWGWVAEAAYLHRYDPSWALSEYDPLILDVVLLLGIGVWPIVRRRAGTRPRVAPAVSLWVLGVVWTAIACVTAITTRTPPDGVDAVLALPTESLVVAPEPGGWSCSADGEFCNATAGVAARDGAGAAATEELLRQHLRARGWHRPEHEGLVKGLLWKIPLHLEIHRQTESAVVVVMFWKADPATS